MSLSYSAITNSGRASLPSVESWSTNNNIIRDPPKSIHTRKVDKVGENTFINEYIEEGSDRANEAIKVYARGTNPFVSVSYSGEGVNNAGQYSGSITGGINSGTQARLPYTVMKDGAFRPPILTQEDLLPLSRLPRGVTSQKSTPSSIDYSKKLVQPKGADKTYEVHSNIIRVLGVEPTKVLKKEYSASKPYDVKYVIQPTLAKSATSGMRTMDIKQQNVQTPSNCLADNVTAYDITSNKSDSTKTSHLVDIIDQYQTPVKNIVSYSVNAPRSGNEKTEYIHDAVKLQRVLPQHESRTNTSDPTVYKQMPQSNTLQLKRNVPVAEFCGNKVERTGIDHTQRTVNLPAKIQPGGFQIPGQVPSYLYTTIPK